MWIVLTVLLAVSSDTTRSMLQDTFAAGSVIVANHLWLCLFATVLLAFAMLVAFSMYQAGKRPAGAPPVVRQRLPLCGSFLPFAKNPLGFAHSCYKKHGQVFTVPIFHRKLTFLLGPGAHDVFFKARDSQVNQQKVYNFMKPVFGKGVVYDASPRMFQQQLRFMARGLKTDALKTYVPKIVKEAQQYFASSKFAASGQFDLAPTIAELIIMTASSCLMGREVREHLHTQVADLYRLLDEGITPLSFFFPNVPIPAHLRRNKARKEMVKLFARVVEQRRAKEKATATNPGSAEAAQADTDILGIFMQARYRDGRQLTATEIAGLMIALLFAGQHTSTITTSWSLLLLLQHPDELAKVMEEQRRLLGDDLSTPLSWENINQMDCLHRVVREAVRMYPPLIFLMREVMKPLKVKGFTIPAGHTIVASGALSMRLPEAFTNPDKFDPDRFAPGRAEDDAKAYAWVGFGAGIHACQGEQFAYLQVKTIVSTMLRMFDLTKVAKELPVPDYKAMVVGPEGPNMIKYTRRS